MFSFIHTFPFHTVRVSTQQNRSLLRHFGTNRSAIQNPLKGQIALVTGGSRGIGKSIAFTLANLGASVSGLLKKKLHFKKNTQDSLSFFLVLSRNPSEIHKTLPIVDTSQRHVSFVCDVANSASVSIHYDFKSHNKCSF